MTMSPSTLASQLASHMVNATTEAAAVTNFVAAYGAYAASATGGAAPITPAGVNLGKAAMAPALTGMSAPGAGVPCLVAGCIAFWAAVAGGLATSFAGATVVVPPTFAGLAALLTATFASNVAGNLTAPQAFNAVATAIHAQTILGGAVTLPGPVVAPIL